MQVVASCLNQDPSKRPSADQLLEYSFFKNCEGLGFLFKKVFNALPNVEERFEEAKALHDGTSSQITASTDTDSAGPRMKTRRISGWKFNDVNSSLTQNSVLSQKMMQLLNFFVLEAKPSKIQAPTWGSAFLMQL